MTKYINKTIIKSDKAPAPIGPYSQAVLHNNILYVSGQIAINAAIGKIVNDTIENETHQVMKNLRAVLKQAKMDFNNIVKCTIFVKDLNDFAKINDIYGSYFTSSYPARETIEVSRLPKDVNVEISCIAHLLLV